MPLNDGRAENAFLLERFRVNFRADFDGVRDFGHHQPDLPLHRKYDQREQFLRRRFRDVEIMLQPHQRQNLMAILHDFAPAGKFDLRGGKLFQTHHKRQRHAIVFAFARAEQHNRLPVILAAVFVNGLRLRFGRLFGFFQVIGGNLRRAEHARRIQNQRNAAVTHDGCAVVKRQLLDVRTQRLHDDFFGVAHVVND